MHGFSFEKNCQFEWDGAGFCIRDLLTDNKLLIESTETGEPRLVNRDDLLAAWAAGLLKAKAPTDTRPSNYVGRWRALGELPAAHQAEIARRLKYVQAIEEQGRPSCESQEYEDLIARVAVAIGDNEPPSTITLYRWNRRWEESGHDPCSLAPRTARAIRSSGAQSPELMAHFEQAVRDVFKQSPQAKGGDIYARLHYLVKITNDRRLPQDAIQVPSLRTVYRLFANMDAYDVACHKEGKSMADRRFRVARPVVHPTRPLERVEIDHTPLDLFLLDHETRLPIGRPTLTVLTDKFSRMPLGYHLSFGSPSAAAVAAALRHAISPKTLCTQAIPGLPIHEDWPCFGLFEVLVVDNGREFLGNDLEALAIDLGFTIQACPKRQPRYKGGIERFLKTINYGLAQSLPGTSFAKYFQRGDYDPETQAVLTLAEFKQIFEKWIVDVYAESVHQGLGVTPRQRWNQSAGRVSLRLPPDRHALDRRIGLTEFRQLRRSGIELHGITYSGDALGEILLRYGDSVRVRVVYDPEDLGEILVWGPDDQDPLPSKALDYADFKGLTAKQHEVMTAMCREVGKDPKDAAARHWAMGELQEAVQQLMNSRKAHPRRRGAGLKGVSSTRPKGDVPKPAKPRAPASPKPAPPPAPSADQSPGPFKVQVLPTFEVRTTRGRDESR